MKKMILAFVLVACMVLSLVGCSNSGNAQSVENIKKAGKIIMYTNAEFAPFEYMKDNQVVGVDVDIASEIAKELGVTLEVQNIDFDAIVAAVQSGKGAFGAAGMTVTEERQKNVDFSVEYIMSKQYIIMMDNSDFKTIEDLAGMSIGVQLGTTGDYLVSDEIAGYEDDDGAPVQGVLQDSGAHVFQYNNAVEATMALTSGKIDAVVIDKLPAENLVAANAGTKLVELVYADGSNTEEYYAICVAKGNSSLLEVINTVLNRLIAEGKIDEFVINHTNQI